MHQQSEQIEKLAAAIVKAQGALEPARKDRTNPFFHSTYADLGSVWEALKPFTENGIAVTQSPADAPSGHISIETQLTHLSGQWMRSRLTLPLSKNDPQGAGSALTYARRYALGCMTGVVTEEDDDGNAASRAAFKPTIPQSRPKQDATMVQPATDKYTGERQEAAGVSEPTDTLETPQPHDVPPPAPSAAEFCKQQAASMSDSPIFTFGKHKGKTPYNKDVPDDYLAWIEPMLAKQVDDPAKARYAAVNQALLDAVRGAAVDRGLIQYGK